MPITQSAKKALRQSRRREKINRRIREVVKKVIKEFKKNPSEKLLRKAYSEIDKAKKKKVFPQNKAARLKSEIGKLLKRRAKKKKLRVAKAKKK